MAVSTNKVQLSGLARKLVVDGLMEESAAAEAFQNALKKKQPFVSYLVENKLADSLKIAQAAAEEFGVPLLDIDSVELDTEITKLLKEDLIRKHHALPLYKRGKRLYVAVSDPTNLQALDEIKFAVGMNTEAILAEETKLEKAIEKMIEASDGGLGEMADEEFDDLDGLDVEDEKQDEQVDTEVDDAPVVRFVNKVLLDAIKKGASDIHFEPYEKFYRVRLRMDGVLIEVARPPTTLALKMAARIKVMSRLDVSERRVPQDGRIKLKVSKHKSIDFRVSTCPTIWGEKVVMRILDSSSAQLGIDVLGYEDFQKELFLENLHKPYGMFLVTGPTGSGKTVSLYTGINILNQTEVNISTAEDPVEINLPGINQVQVDEKTGLTFAKALKAFLRQDPDIILVGEIRDLETGGIALKAAMTGHMVMSTLHTNDAPQTLTRMQDMGMPTFGIATSVNIIIAQRLARRLCKNCVKPIEVPNEVLLEEGFTDKQIEAGIKISEAEGCDQCNAGYKGRTGIYQVMPVSEAMRRMIMDGATAIQLADQSRAEGIPDIRQSALKKVADGIIDMKEVNRVTQE
ncbi:type IV pilus assembly protein PilB [Methylohalomonas lacus]|uniref:Type IV pilus assembly protein PilB n=1 Tax=Methylohalomonas lacus TaxID=398773 RepID=A0AAE3HK72_9GAMM|nr:type IV-A pilus assembly ATPase PilB [Methylohalomonas lacus]MCS3903870.1 type IV pilus assembly protein PilB [Methylohalomonas lacus]